MFPVTEIVQNLWVLKLVLGNGKNSMWLQPFTRPKLKIFFQIWEKS
eukprot:UN11025